MLYRRIIQKVGDESKVARLVTATRI